MHGLPVQEFSSTGSDFPWFLSLFILLKSQSCLHPMHVYKYIHRHIVLLHNNKDCLRYDLAVVYLQGEKINFHIFIYNVESVISVLAIQL